MSRTQFYVNWQIDSEATQHAIQDPELGKRADTALFEILEEHNLKGNFMVIPGDAAVNAGLYREFHTFGHEIGLQIHPGDEGFFEFTGVMGPDEQRSMMAHCKKKWADALGFEPKALNIGYCSTNDFTFGIAEEFGFSHGILTFPERTVTEIACTFPGAPRDVHYANRYNRMLPGDMDFVNIPLTIDPDSRMWGGR